MSVPRRLLGSRDLGLEVEWRFRFIGMGERAETTPGVVFIDVGGSLAPGILDHHGGEGTSCASRLVVDRREYVYNHLLGPWLVRHEEGRIVAGARWTPTLVAHVDPDFDSVAAAFLIGRLIEDGDLPPYAPALAAYALEVDQGRFPLPVAILSSPAGSVPVLSVEPAQLQAMHFAYLALQSRRAEEGREATSEEKLLAGLRLLETTLEAIKAARGGRYPTRMAELLPGSPGVGAWRELPEFAPLAELLESDAERFREDLEAAGEPRLVELPASDGGEPLRVRAFVGAGPPRSVLSKYWVRASGIPLFVCPLGEETNGPGEAQAFDRVVLSIDPNFSIDGRRPNLRGLGFRLESAEVAARRSGRGEVRRGTPRYDDGSCDNEDPWYDGRGHDWTIVDSPRTGTKLFYGEIVAIATGGDFWKVPLTGGTIKLVWAGPPDASSPSSDGPLERFPSMSETLAAFYAESSESEAPPRVVLPPRPGAKFRAREHVRRFPEGTCSPLRIVEIACAEGATLEDLVACRAAVVAPGLPEFSLARVGLGLHFSAPVLVDRLLSELGGADLSPVAALSSDRELVLFSRRSLVFRQLGARPEAFGPDPDLEVLLYVAFLYQSLLVFSQRLSDLVPPGGSELAPGNTRRIREDFLRFQTRYYQLEVSRDPRGRSLFGELCTALGLHGLYAEVQSEVDRLAQLEAQIEAEKREKANLWIEARLFVLAFFGVAQTVIGYLAWPERDVAVLLGMVPFFLASLGIFLWAKLRHRSREKG